jgi:transcriptional regulator with XRE-family HTH domain
VTSLSLYDTKGIILQVSDITSEQIKAARAALGWTIDRIAQGTGIGTATLKRYEASAGVPKSRKGHLRLLKEYLEAAGIEFIGSPSDRPGIRIATPRRD